MNKKGKVNSLLMIITCICSAFIWHVVSEILKYHMGDLKISLLKFLNKIWKCEFLKTLLNLHLLITGVKLVIWY